MIDKLSELMSAAPVVSVVLIALLLAFFGYLLRDELKIYIKKRLNLYDETEIVAALEQAADERLFYSKTSEQLTPTVQERVVTFLKRNRSTYAK